MASEIVKRGFAMNPANLQEAMQLANMLAGSQVVPKYYQGKAQDALVAMMMGAEIGLNPIQSLQNIAVINGRPSIWGDAMVALVQNHPAFGGIEESFDDATMTASCTVWRNGGPRQTQTFSEVDAKKAGLWNKAGPWQQYPKRMLQLRARGFALRNQFADAIAGLITAEEAQDMPIERDITPAVTLLPENSDDGTADWLAAIESAVDRDGLGAIRVALKDSPTPTGAARTKVVSAWNARLKAISGESQ